MISFVSNATKLIKGFSYWKITLSSGKIITEGQVCYDILRGTRNIDWALDIVGSGDNKHIKQIALCTPQCETSLDIIEPYSTFQLKLGTQMFFGQGNKVEQAQIIGRVDDKQTGACTSIIWDILEQKIYTHVTNIYYFEKWRENTLNIGKLSFDVIGVRLDGGVS